MRSCQRPWKYFRSLPWFSWLRSCSFVWFVQTTTDSFYGPRFLHALARRHTSVPQIDIRIDLPLTLEQLLAAFTLGVRRVSDLHPLRLAHDVGIVIPLRDWRTLALCRPSYILLGCPPRNMTARSLPPKKRPHSVRTLLREIQNQKLVVKHVPSRARPNSVSLVQPAVNRISASYAGADRR